MKNNIAYCPKCGSPIPGNARFCGVCGMNLAALEQEPSAPQNSEPSYSEPSYAEPAYEQPAYAEPSYEQPSYAEPSYEQPSQEEPAYGEPASGPAAPRRPQGGAYAAKKKNQWIYWAVGGVLLVVLAVGAVLLLGGKEQKEPAPAAETTALQTEPETTAAVQTETEALLLTQTAARQQVEQAYACEARLSGTDGNVAHFWCYGEDGEKLGVVDIDLSTGAMTVAEGMEPPETEPVLPALTVDPQAAAAAIEQGAPGADWSYMVLDLQSGEAVGSDNQAEGQSASALINIPILYALSRIEDDGNIYLDDTLPFTYSTSGRGTLTESDDGQNFSLETLLSAMLQYSDNNATNSLLNSFPPEYVTEICRENGFESVSIVNYIGSTEDFTENDNYVSCQDLCGMLKALYEKETGIGRAFLQENMVIQDASALQGLGAALPDGVLFLNHNGIKDQKYNEVAVVEDGDRVYAIAFLSSGVGSDQLKTAASLLGQYVGACVHGQE